METRFLNNQRAYFLMTVFWIYLKQENIFEITSRLGVNAHRRVKLFSGLLKATKLPRIWNNFMLGRYTWTNKKCCKTRIFWQAINNSLPFTDHLYRKVFLNKAHFYRKNANKINPIMVVSKQLSYLGTETSKLEGILYETPS